MIFRKKSLLTLYALAIGFLILSSTVAVQAVQGQTLIKMVKKQEKINFSCIDEKHIISLTSANNENYKLEEMVKQLRELTHNKKFMEILEKIEKSPFQRELKNIILRTIKRLEGIKRETSLVKNNVASLKGLYNLFKKPNGKLSPLLMSLKDYLDNGEPRLPLVIFVLYICGVVSLLWMIPLVILLGKVGLGIGEILTLLWFTPVILPIQIIVSCAYALQIEGVQEKLKEFFLDYGLVGLMIYGIPYLAEIIASYELYAKANDYILKYLFFYIDIE